MSTCQCNMAISMLGDGCRYCQPQTYIEHLLETLEDARTAPVSEAKAQGVALDGSQLAGLLEQVRLDDDEAKLHGSGAPYWNNAVVACQVAIRDALAAPVQQVSAQDEMRSLAQRLREYNQSPHHINPMSEAFHILVADAANALSTACVPKEIAAAITWSEHLLFECGALTSTRAPSVHVYNKTFAAVNEARAMLAAAPVSEVKAQGEYGDAYQGAREDLAIWKRRALEAEEKVLQQEQIIDHLASEAQGESRFGEPVVTPDAPCVPDGYVLADKKALGTVLQALVNAPHHIRELQVTRQPVELFSDNPINVLIANYEAPAAPAAPAADAGVNDHD